MRTVVLTYILAIMLVINFFKATGIFKEEINFYTSYVFMEVFGTASSIVIDKELSNG